MGTVLSFGKRFGKPAKKASEITVSVLPAALVRSSTSMICSEKGFGFTI